MKNFSDLTYRLLAVNFDEEPKKKKGKKTEVSKLQVGDYFRAENDKEYVVTEYINKVHGADQKNLMQEPNTILLKVFDCETEELIKVKFNIEDEVEVIKSDKDLYKAIYTKNKIQDGQKIAKEYKKVILAKNKSDAEDELSENSNISLVSFEKLLHGKIKDK